MAALFYSLCTITALFCSFLLLRGYLRNGYKLLFWGGLCFLGLTLNNGLVVLDKVMYPDVDLYLLRINMHVWRLALALLSLLVLLYGLIWDSD